MLRGNRVQTLFTDRNTTAAGTPDEVAAVEGSHTGRYLGPLLKPRRVAAE